MSDLTLNELRLSDTEPAPAKKAAAVAKKAPTSKKEPAVKKAPTAKKEPAVKKAPAAKKEPTVKTASAAKKEPAVKNASAAKKPKKKDPEVGADASTDEMLDETIAAQPLLMEAFALSPADVGQVVIHGASQHMLNAMARKWVQKFETGKLTAVHDVPGAMCCEGYTTLDLAACSTAAERNSAIAFIRSLRRGAHATRQAHLVIIYDAHLAVPSRVLRDLTGVNLILTTTAPHAICKSFGGSAMFVRVKCESQTPPQLLALAKAAFASACVPAARRFAHEASKLCLGQAAPYKALLDVYGGQNKNVVSERAAELQHIGTKLTRPTNALEVFAMELFAMDSA